MTRAKQKVTAGVPWPEVPSVKGRRPSWYALKTARETQVFMMYGINDRYIHPMSTSPAISDRRFHMVRYGNYNPEVIAALLNTFLTTLFIEIYSRSNLGQGALDFATVDANRILVPNPAQLPHSTVELLRERLADIQQRAIEPVWEESQEPDRRVLDDVVFDALGLTQGEREAVYEAVVELVRKRLEKARSV